MFQIGPQENFKPVHIHTLAHHLALSSYICFSKCNITSRLGNAFINRIITACLSIKLKPMYSNNNQARKRYLSHWIIHIGELEPQEPSYFSSRLLPSNECFRVCALTLACNLFVCVFDSPLGLVFVVRAGLGSGLGSKLSILPPHTLGC